MLAAKFSLQAVILVSCYNRFKYSSVSYPQVQDKTISEIDRLASYVCQHFRVPLLFAPAF
jgi:hypothetical protein